MYKKTIFTILIFIVPIGLIENHINEKYPIEKTKKLDILNQNNRVFVDDLFAANEQKSIEIKNCWEEGDLASQKRYCSSPITNLKDF